MARPEVESTSVNRARSSSTHDTFAVQEQSQQSLGFLQSAEDFSIHDANIASIGGDSFTARGDVHVTINHHYPPSPSSSSNSLNLSNGNQELEHPNVPSMQTQRGTFSEDMFTRIPLRVQRSCDIYRRHLEAKGRGISLWIPEPSKNLPIQYQRNGIAIGDVGIITPSGSFIFLFNVCNPSTMPPGFEPVASDVIRRFNIAVQREFREHSYLASVSSVKRRDGDSTGLVFESSEHDGAILTMPVGAKSEDLTNVILFRKYITANLPSWYRYAYHDQGYEIRNGDLRVVTGTDKTSAWGMATFSNSAAGCSTLVAGNEPKFHLEFGLIENGDEASDHKLKRYGWEYSGVAEVRAGPDAREIAELRGDDGDEEDAVYENQCLFIRTLNATLPEKVWEQLGIDEEEADFGYGYGYHSSNDSTTGGSSSSSGRGGNGNSSRLDQGGSFSSSASHNQAAISTSTRTSSIGPYSRKTPNYSSSISLADHPSNAINQFLLNNCSEDTSMAVTLDQDWISVLREDDCVLPSFEELLERIMEVYDIREEDGIVFLDAKCQNLEGTSHASSNLAILYSEDNISEMGSEEPLDSLEDFDLDVAGTDPTISKCASILKSTYQTIKNVKVHKQKCKNLCDRNKQLLQEIQALDIEEAPDIMNELDHIIIQIDRKAQEWSSWSPIQSFLRSGGLLQDVERCRIEIDDLSRKISILNVPLRPLKLKGVRDRYKPGFEYQCDIAALTSLSYGMPCFSELDCLESPSICYLPEIDFGKPLDDSLFGVPELGGYVQPGFPGMPGPFEMELGRQAPHSPVDHSAIRKRTRWISPTLRLDDEAKSHTPSAMRLDEGCDESPCEHSQPAYRLSSSDTFPYSPCRSVGTSKVMDAATQRRLKQTSSWISDRFQISSKTSSTPTRTADFNHRTYALMRHSGRNSSTESPECGISSCPLILSEYRVTSMGVSQSASQKQDLSKVLLE